ncbi:MAG: hypothetical protein KTR32_39505 [Granulosicoccus sp.]|nr:hypothetical protein [Granulosicoccus sp.]
MKSSRAENTSNTGSALRGNRAIFADRIEQVKELFPLTVLGVLVAVLAVSGLSKFGFDRLDLVWYVAALCALMLIALTIC